MRGGRYSIDFLVDQRRCDIFSVLTAVLSVYGENKEACDFIMKNFESLKQDEIVNLQVEFEERGTGKTKGKNNSIIAMLFIESNSWQYRKF